MILVPIYDGRHKVGFVAVDAAVCGQDRCDHCDRCLHCHPESSCEFGRNGGHLWIYYIENFSWRDRADIRAIGFLNRCAKPVDGLGTTVGKTPEPAKV